MSCAIRYETRAKHIHSIVRRFSILGYINAGRMRQVDNERVRQHVKLVSLHVKLHQVRYFVPSETEKSSVKCGHVATHNYVRFEISFPFDLFTKQNKTKQKKNNG